MTTPNLAIPLIVASQSQKEVTANAAFTALDRAITATIVADVGAGSVALTAAQHREALGVRVINATVVGRVVTLPMVERYALISVDGATSTEDVIVQRGTASAVTRDIASPNAGALTADASLNRRQTIRICACVALAQVGIVSFDGQIDFIDERWSQHAGNNSVAI